MAAINNLKRFNKGFLPLIETLLLLSLINCTAGLNKKAQTKVL